jgi:hypothetical protein
MNQILIFFFIATSVVAFKYFNGKNQLSITKLHSDAVDSSKPTLATKGFGKPKSASENKNIEEDIGSVTYEKQAKRGVPEYNIFLRPNNGTEVEWIPVGSMTISRDTKVSKAVYEVESELLKGTFKLYPKLKLLYDTKKDKSNVFEYGYCLKAFPDELIQLIKKENNAENTNFFANW